MLSALRAALNISPSVEDRKELEEYITNNFKTMMGKVTYSIRTLDDDLVVFNLFKT